MTLSQSVIAPSPSSPYYAVIFTSLHTEDEDGYAQTASEMLQLAAAQPGFIGVESVRDANGLGITVSYWQSTAAISDWKHHADHIAAQNAGRQRWYRAYAVRICKVERAYTFGC